MPGKQTSTKRIESLKRPTFLAGFSMGSKYHDQGNSINDQLELIEKNNPAKIYTFVADIQHYMTDLVKDLMTGNSKVESEEDFNSQRLELENKYLLRSYYKGQEWINNYGRYIGAASTDSFLGKCAFDSTDDINKDDNDSTHTEYCNFSWKDFDTDTYEYLSALLESGKEIKVSSISNEADSKEEYTPRHKSENVPSEDDCSCDSSPGHTDRDSASICSPDSQLQLMALLFKSIYLNSMVYYLNGSLIKLKQCYEEKKDSTDNSAEEFIDYERNYEKYTTKQRDILTGIEASLSEHNKVLDARNIPDVYRNIAYNAADKQKKKAHKQKIKEQKSSKFVDAVFTDISKYLKRNYRKSDAETLTKPTEIAIDTYDWKIQEAIMYSVKHQCQNIASIGIYSLVYGVTYYTYPRQLGESPDYFSKNVLVYLIKELYDTKSISDESDNILYFKNLGFTFFQEENKDKEKEYTLIENDLVNFDKSTGKFKHIDTHNELGVILPKRAEQRILTPRSSISNEALKKMADATKTAFDFYSDKRGKAIETSARLERDLDHHFPEEYKKSYTAGFVGALANWSKIETSKFEKIFKKGSNGNIDDNVVQETITIIIFIITLCRELTKTKEERDTEIQQQLNIDRNEYILDFYANFLWSLDSEAVQTLKNVAEQKLQVSAIIKEKSHDHLETFERAGDKVESNEQQNRIIASLEETIAKMIKQIEKCKNDYIETNDRSTPKKVASTATPPRRSRSGSTTSQQGTPSSTSPSASPSPNASPGGSKRKTPGKTSLIVDGKSNSGQFEKSECKDTEPYHQPGF